MTQTLKEIGNSREEIYEKIEREYGKNYRVLSKDRQSKYVFPFFLKRQYIFEYEITKEIKKDKKTIIEILKQSKTNREAILTNEAVNLNDVKKSNIPETNSKKELTTECLKIWGYLKEQELDTKWIEYLFEQAQKDNPNTVEEWKNSINKIIESEIDDFVEKNNYQILTVFGPTGVGKTTTLIKIMNRLQKGNKKIGVLTTDNFRVGAYEQMRNYSERLQFPLIQSNVDELEIPVNMFKHQKGMDYILVDTYGRNPKDEEMKNEIEMYIKKVNPENVSLVLAANQKYKDMTKTIRAYQGINIDHLIITKIDETDSYGFLYNLYKEFKIPISYLTFGQKVPDDIELFSTKIYLEKLWESFSD